MTLTLSVCHAWGNPTLTLRSAGLIARTVLAVSFLFRERLRPSRSPIFFLPGICEKKQQAEDLSVRWQASSRRLNARNFYEAPGEWMNVRMNERTRTVPPWDLPNRTKGPRRAPVWTIAILEPQSALVKNYPAVSTGFKRVGDLQALSIKPVCLEFGPNDSKVVLKPRLGYVTKVLSTPFRDQVITLSAFFPPTGSQESLLCPIRALRVYIECSASYRKSEQLFVGFGNQAKEVALLRSREFLGG